MKNIRFTLMRLYYKFSFLNRQIEKKRRNVIEGVQYIIYWKECVVNINGPIRLCRFWYEWKIKHKKHKKIIIIIIKILLLSKYIFVAISVNCRLFVLFCDSGSSLALTMFGVWSIRLGILSLRTRRRLSHSLGLIKCPAVSWIYKYPTTTAI